MVERNKRPTPEDLESYEREYDDENYDYDPVRIQLGHWLHDNQRRQEEEREREKRGTPLAGHGGYNSASGNATSGYDEGKFFDLGQVNAAAQKRPLH